MTTDPQLKVWRILSEQKPLIGTSERAPDGVENVAIFQRSSGGFVMIFSEGLAAQHLAYATSIDLMLWQQHGTLEVPKQPWAAGRFGAPYVWAEQGCFYMVLMGEAEVETHDSAFGLLASVDGTTNWTALGKEE
mmetsp:Transcript_100/g.210  ORF Transcript_100/g.210 Transcript_100/m.210 type:complete len:134 (-) Transcript_100:76-477(-)